jgi:hypothetical protein
VTVISNVIGHPHPDVDVKEYLESLVQAKKLIEGIDGVQSVVAATVTIGGPATNAFALTTTVADWETFGKVQAHINSDPEFIGFLMEAGKLGSWETYVGQELDLDLIPS